ncbi:MAG: dipeptidase [Porticoccaceae bacterium]|jgi:membrane dipeptidase|nr:dipeptidase [Porticoccaceae bacterium]MBT7169134.1 dipeptidase [Porticoccaceae bacterium]MBT7752154.1 dipeptidase [Porticoccaceae bacterium]
MSRLLVPLLFLILSQVGCNVKPKVEATTAAPIDQNAILMAQAQAIHASALTLDAHADIEIPGKPSMYVGSDGLSKVAPTKMRAGGLDAVVMSLAVGPMPRNAEGYAAAKALAQTKLVAVTALAANPDNNATITKSTDELTAAHAEGKSALILGFQNALILGTDVTGIDRLYDVGVRVFALTHMGHNDFADSSRTLFDGDTGTREPDAEHGGLSALGKAAVVKINALGGIVDVSQLSSQAALQAIGLSVAPVIASHSNARALTNVSRNLSDREIDRIGETGGVIHIAPFRGYLFDSSAPNMDKNIRAVRKESGIEEDYLYPFELYWEIDDLALKRDFLTRTSALLGPIGLDEMLDHVDYIVERIGVDHVGIGTDFNHGSGIIGFDDASEALNVTLALLKRGYSKDDIIKIWGGNFIRVWRAAEKASDARVLKPQE